MLNIWIINFAWVMLVSSLDLGSICVQDGMSEQNIWAACGTMHTTAWRYIHFTVVGKPAITSEICIKVKHKGICVCVSLKRKRHEVLLLNA